MGIIDFFIEAFNRIKTKSPLFFTILQGIGIGVIIFGRSPWLVDRYTSWTMPQGLLNLCNDISSRAEGFLLAALFAIRTKPIAQTESGEAVRVTDEKKMPFTAKEEAKLIEKTSPEPPVIEVPKNDGIKTS